MTAPRIAIIGCGHIARKHIFSLLELGEAVEVSAICDSNGERLEAFANEICRPVYPNVKLFTSIDAMLAADDAGLVVIATGSDSHCALARKALRKGRHVLVEKPLALSLADARMATEEAEKRGLVLAVSFQARYLQQMAALRTAVREGLFGQMAHGIVSMRWNRSEAYYSDRPWRDDWKRGGGLFMNQCIHYIDLLQWIMGPVVSVYAQAAVVGQEVNVENTGAVVLRFQSGAIGLVEASTAVRPASAGTSISLFGSKGSAVIGGARLDEIKQWLFETEPGKEILLPEAASDISHVPLYRDLLNAISAGGGDLTVAAGTTLHSHEIVLAVYQSVASGKAVHLPIADFDMVRMAWME